MKYNLQRSEDDCVYMSEQQTWKDFWLCT